MVKTEKIRARVDAWLKADAEAVLRALGLTVSDAIRRSRRWRGRGILGPALGGIPWEPGPVDRRSEADEST